MPRIPTRFQPLVSPTSPGGARITRAELQQATTGAPVAELRTLGDQAVDALEDGEALRELATRIGGDAVLKAPVSSLADFASGRALLDGTLQVTRGATGDARTATLLLQRTLMKIGAHHPEGRNHPELMLMPWGADGDLGNATVVALNRALTLAGRADLATLTTSSTVGKEVATVLQGLLAQTPAIRMPSTPPHPGTVTPPPTTTTTTTTTTGNTTPPARIAARFHPLLAATSAGGARMTRAELQQAAAGASSAELRALGNQAVDAVQDGDALRELATRLGGEGAVKAPLSSLEEGAQGRAWLQGALELKRGGTGDVKEAVILMQRALIKVGAHHPEGRNHPELLQMPWGADGDLGNGTIRALNKALVLAGRADLATLTTASTIGKEVATALQGLLAQTPTIRMAPPPAPGPVTPPAGNGTATLPNADVFGARALTINRTGYEEKWVGVLQKMDAEKDGYFRANPDLNASAKYWLNELETCRGKPELFQLNRVNSIINGWNYRGDDENYGRDHWASPLEFFTRRGDCEDYVMAKWASLVLLGFPEERLRLVAVDDRDQGMLRHAVLAVDMPDGTYILDNQTLAAKKHDELMSLDGGLRYVPRVAMGRQGRWVYGAPVTPPA